MRIQATYFYSIPDSHTSFMPNFFIVREIICDFIIVTIYSVSLVVRAGKKSMDGPISSNNFAIDIQANI